MKLSLYGKQKGPTKGAINFILFTMHFVFMSRELAILCNLFFCFSTYDNLFGPCYLKGMMTLAWLRCGTLCEKISA
jgi:hypothetical protein